MQIFPKFFARFARKSYFLIFFSNSLQSFGILKHLFTYISINFLTKPTSINAFSCIPGFSNINHFIQAIKLYIIHRLTVIYPPVAWVQLLYKSAFQKCLELHDFVPIFLKIFWGRTPHPLPGISKGIFKSILALLKILLWFVYCCCFFFKITPPPPTFPIEKQKKKKKKKSGPPLFWNPGSATAHHTIIRPDKSRF